MLVHLICLRLTHVRLDDQSDAFITQTHVSSVLVGSTKNYHDQLLSFTRKYLNSITNDLLRMALALRSYSPTVEMMRKMAHDTGMTRQCSTFVDVHGLYTCHVDDIDRLIASANERYTSFVDDRFLNKQYERV
jgi:hypothetical protein